MSSLKYLARSLGLSITTVSRALDDYGDVAEVTRKRVRAEADAIGYRPNAAARRLRKGSTELVTLVLPTEPGQFNEPLYIELLVPMGQRLAREGYDLTLIAAAPGPDEMKTYRRLVEGRRTDGIVVVRTRRQDARIAYLDKLGFPFVAMGRCEGGHAHAFIDGDGETAFADAVRRLVAMGHRHIAHVAAPSAFTFANLRRQGYVRAMEEAGLEPVIVEDAADETGGFRVAIEALGRHMRPTALLCATDRMAFGALRAARRLGLVVPRDLSVIGHDNLVSAQFCEPPLTTMELPIVSTGVKLAEMMLARIGGADPTALQEICEVKFIERESTSSPGA
jgi:LacI family transcriptional regulator